MEKLDDGTFLPIDTNDSPFSYHLALLTELNKAILSDDIQKYHYNFLRNILEKTATFLGYGNWGELLPAESREHIAGESICIAILNIVERNLQLLKKRIKEY